MKIRKNNDNFLKTERKTEPIKLVNEAANKYFIGIAQLLRKLEILERSLKENAKLSFHLTQN